MPSSDALLDIVKQAFFDSHDGVSTDELLCDDDKLRVFDEFTQRKAQAARIAVTVTEARHLLLNIRKSGKLGPVVDKRYRGNHDPYKHIAETAARICEDRYRTTVDRILCEPAMRKDFDDAAAQFRTNASAKDIRLAAMGLRKAKQLRPLVAQTLLRPHRSSSSVSRRFSKTGRRCRELQARMFSVRHRNACMSARQMTCTVAW